MFKGVIGDGLREICTSSSLYTTHYTLPTNSHYTDSGAPFLWCSAVDIICMFHHTIQLLNSSMSLSGVTLRAVAVAGTRMLSP